MLLIIDEGAPSKMFKVHQLLPPETSDQSEIRVRLISDYADPLETSFWGCPATRITISNGERIYVRETRDELDKLWLRID